VLLVARDARWYELAMEIRGCRRSPPIGKMHLGACVDSPALGKLPGSKPVLMSGQVHSTSTKLYGLQFQTESLLSRRFETQFDVPPRPNHSLPRE